MQWEYPRLLVQSEKLPLYCFRFNHRLELYIFHCNRHHYILQITHFYILQLLITIFQNNVIQCQKVDRGWNGDVGVTGWQPCVSLGPSSGCLVGNVRQHNGHCWLRQTLLSSQWNLQTCIQVFHSESTCKYSYNIRQKSVNMQFLISVCAFTVDVAQVISLSITALCRITCFIEMGFLHLQGD